MKYFRKSILLLSALALAAASLAGCHSQTGAAGPAMAETEVRITAEEPDPERAAAEIYAGLPDCEVAALTMTEIETTFEIAKKDVQDIHAYLSDPNKGLADLVMVLPKPESRDSVREALHRYQSRCMEEYRDYDILDSYAIAQEALIFDQGDYLVLLMLPDNEAAREILDRFMPL